MSKTILLVDDDKSLSRLFQEMLPREGFAVICERDGEWALNTFNQRPIDVVLLDVLVPVLNGFQVAERIRQTEKGKNVPIVFMSGIYKAQNHREAVRQKYGALEFLEKPFQAEKLIALLREALGDAYPKREERAAEEAKIEQKAASLADESTRAEASEVEREAGTFKGGQSARGTFRTKPFAEIVAELFRWRATGALLLRRDKVKKIVYFKEGRPIFIKSNLLSECLGKVMVRERMITEAECEESLRKMKETGRQQGTILIEMGCISPHNLKYALQLQLETKLFDVFGWKTGDWQFNPKADVPLPLTTLEMSPASMIYEGLRRTYDGKRVREALGHVDDYLAVPSPDPLLRFQDIGMDAEETRLWEMIDGKRTVGELARAGILPEEEAYRFIYAMKCAQMIELVPGGEEVTADDLVQESALPPAAQAAPSAPEESDDERHDRRQPVPPPPVSGVEKTQPRPLASQERAPAGIESLPPASCDDLDKTPLEAFPPVGDEAPRANPPLFASLLHPPSAPVQPPPPAPWPTPAEKRAAAEEKPTAAPPASLTGKAPDAPAPLASLLGGALPSPAPFASLLGGAAAPGPSPSPEPRAPEGSASRATAASPASAPLASLLGAPPPAASDAAPALFSLPGRTSGPAMHPDDASTRERLLAKIQEFKSQNLYKALGVDVDATREQVRRAYFALSREYHPDKHFATASAEVRALANELFDLITHAYEVLADPDSREEYRMTLPEEERERRGVDPMSAILAAEGRFKKGRALLEAKSYKEALELFKEAARLYPEEGDFHAYLGWSLYQLDPKNKATVQQATDSIERAIALNPKSDKAYLFLGHIYKATGKTKAAFAQYEKAIRVNPDCKEALDELKALAG